MNAVDPVNAAFSASVRRLRAERHMSKAELARLARISPDRITCFEEGAGGPNLATAGRIAEAFGVPFPEMFADLAASAAMGADNGD